MAHSVRSSPSTASVHTLRSSDMRGDGHVRSITVLDYLFKRMFDLGVRAVHGVPGSQSAFAQASVEAVGMFLVGNCNWINAGYAADGYARIKGLSVLLADYGSGDFLTLNAIAGAHAEYIPIVYVAMLPPHECGEDAAFVPPTYSSISGAYHDVARSVTCCWTMLDNPREAPSRIDHAIQQCCLQNRPVYLGVPTDIAQSTVDGSKLRDPIDRSLPPTDQEKEEYVAEVVLRYLNASTNAIILVDGGALRHRVTTEVNELVQRSGLPTFVSPLGKGAVDETMPNYCGVYAGDGNESHIRETVEAADLVLNIGILRSDYQSIGFTYQTSRLSTIDFFATAVKVKYSEYSNVNIGGVLHKMIKRLSTIPQAYKSIVQFPTVSRHESLDLIVSSWFWRQLGRWLRPNDIVVAEAGIANMGIWRTRFPQNVTVVSQNLWASPGYAVAACQGACLAARELSQQRNDARYRTILFTGASSFQHTMQEISVMIRHRLNPIIFLISAENSTTTSPHLSHGTSRSPSDEPSSIGDPKSGRVGPPKRCESLAPSLKTTSRRWRYRELFEALGASRGSVQICSVRSRKQVCALFTDPYFSEATGLQFVELQLVDDDTAACLSSSRKTQM